MLGLVLYLILIFVLAWSLIGAMFYNMEVDEGYFCIVQTDKINKAQLNFVILCCGPGVWFYKLILLPFWNSLGDSDK